MNYTRPARLIVEETTELINTAIKSRDLTEYKTSAWRAADDEIEHYETIQDLQDLQIGDEVTGFEIITMLPIEEQTSLKEEIYCDDTWYDICEYPIATQWGEIRLNELYVYNGEGFEPKGANDGD